MSFILSKLAALFTLVLLALMPSITLAQAQARLEREGVVLYWGHLVQHFPAGGHNGNELPDQPVVL